MDSLEPDKRQSDLKVRALSSIIMIMLVFGALWAGGTVFAFVTAVLGVAIMLEWWGLVRRITTSSARRFMGLILGVAYIGLAGFALVSFRIKDGDLWGVLALIAVVIATDVGAYFAGRNLGGPKLAPRISPNKTWSGLLGGMAAAALVWWSYHLWSGGENSIVFYVIGGAIMAVVAQLGDLLESWMKRRAGVKDSGNTIPGHGGLLDRADGHIALFFMIGLTHITIIRDMWL